MPSIPAPNNDKCLLASLGLSFGLLVNVGLETSLVGLASIVLLLVLSSSSVVAKYGVDSLTNSTANTVLDTLVALGEDALGFLALALLVHLAALLLQALAAGEVANKLLGTTSSLLHVATHLIVVIRGDTRRGDSATRYLDRRLGCVVLEISLVLPGLGLGL